ncbi:MAG: CorA family divalent cation transporter, partial [Chloroflexota bacterium]
VNELRIQVRNGEAKAKELHHTLEEKAQRFTQDDLSPYFGDMNDHLNRVWETLEECRETVEIFKDSDFVLATDRTNRMLTVLTIIFVIMLPFTVVSSIYGMNIALPGGIERGSLTTFIIIFGLMILIAGGMLAIFRRRGWI